MAMQLRPLSIGELLDRTFSLYRNNFVLFVGIGAIPMATAMVMVLLMVAVAGAAFFVPGRGGTASAAMAGFLIVLPVFGFVYIAAWALSQGAAVYALSQVYAERKATITDSYRFVMKRFWPLVLLVITTCLIVMASFIVGLLALIIGCVVGAFLAMCYCSLAVPVMVFEGQGVADSLSRSYRLVKTDLGKVFLVLLVAVVVQYAAIYLAAIPSLALLIAFSHNAVAAAWINIISNLVQVVAGAVAAPVMPIGLALAYYDIRVRQEALDLQMMMASLGPVSTPGAPSVASQSTAAATAGNASTSSPQ